MTKKVQKYLAAILIVGMAGFMIPAGAVSADPPRKAIIAELHGDAEVRIGGKDWMPAEVGMELFEKDEIKTGADGFAKLLLDEGGSTGKIELDEGSHLQITAIDLNESNGDKTTYLNLAIGRVMVYAEKLHGDSKFEVRTPNASAGVRGTVFEVSVE